MSPQSADQPLATVTVNDSIGLALTNRLSTTYISPPHTRPQALILARLLLGSADTGGGDGQQTVAIPGGRRTVTIIDVDGQ